MTLAELMDMTRVLVQTDALSDGTLAQFLNLAQEDVGRNLRLPTQTVFFKNVDHQANFNWPADARPDGIIQVYALTLNEDGDVTNSTAIPIYTFNSASQYEPNWTTEKAADQARFIVFDPSAEVESPYPVPPPSPSHRQSFRINYVVKPDKMEEANDQPFNGKLDAFHDVLAYRAAFLISQNNAMYAEYERRMREARSATRRDRVMTVNPMYQQNVISHGRG